MNDTDFTTEHTENTEERNRINVVTEAVIGAAIDVHRVLGPGLLESTYEICLCRELQLRDIGFQRQQPITIEYKGVRLDCGYRADLIIEDTVLIELKAVETLSALHEAQLMSYLKLSDLPAGLLINFNGQLLKHGIRRRLARPDPPALS